MTPDINCAKEYFSKNVALNGKFGEYSAAYAVTNEDLRTSLRFLQKNTENALTVAGSGDHPMFIKMYGAKHVDTFDLSYNAKLIMDIKTIALSLLKHEEYCKFLKDIYVSKDLLSIDFLPQVIEKLSLQEQTYLKAMRYYKIFGHGLHPDFYCDTNRPFPSLTEYKKMQDSINQPFNFIWSDITNLHTKIEKIYDFMHLSNILDYTKEPTDLTILSNLMKHTQIGSVICFETFHYCSIPSRLFMNQSHSRFLMNKYQIWTYRRPTIGESTHVMRRIR